MRSFDFCAVPLSAICAAMDSLIRQIRQELKNNADPQTKSSGKNFFKEDVMLYGVKTMIVTKIAKRFFVHLEEADKDDVFELCEQLWQSGYMEESFIACQWAYRLRDQFAPKDFRILARCHRKDAAGDEAKSHGKEPRKATQDAYRRIMNNYEMLSSTSDQSG